MRERKNRVEKSKKIAVFVLIWAEPKYGTMHLIVFMCLLAVYYARATDITGQAFGVDINDTIVSAFGDFNSDELTDVFVRSTDGRTIEILLASDQEPLLRRSPNTICTFKRLNITSIVPGDFDGDAFMDLLITSKSNTSDLLEVYINWGASDILNCTDETVEPLIRMYGEPVALDYNSDMIIDLFGLNENRSRTFWIFNKNHELPHEIAMELPTAEKEFADLVVPNSHAYLDLNNDFRADLFLVTKTGFEIWHGAEHGGFNYSESRNPAGIRNAIYGQSIFLDIELNGNIAQVLPVCFDRACHSSAILAYVNGDYFNLDIDFNEDRTQMWQFIPPDATHNSIYQNTISLRGGDFNLDGYPDMMVTLQTTSGKRIRTVLMENVAYQGDGDATPLKRTFAIRWKAFSPYSDGTVVGAFYDFYQVNLEY